MIEFAGNAGHQTFKQTGVNLNLTVFPNASFMSAALQDHRQLKEQANTNNKSLSLFHKCRLALGFRTNYDFILCMSLTCLCVGQTCL